MYSTMDLSFLCGHSILIPYQHQRTLERSQAEVGDHLIKSLDMYYGTEFEACFDNCEARLERLYLLKDKWTFRELFV